MSEKERERERREGGAYINQTAETRVHGAPAYKILFVMWALFYLFIPVLYACKYVGYWRGTLVQLSASF